MDSPCLIQPTTKSYATTPRHITSKKSGEVGLGGGNPKDSKMTHPHVGWVEAAGDLGGLHLLTHTRWTFFCEPKPRGCADTCITKSFSNHKPNSLQFHSLRSLRGKYGNQNHSE